MPYSKTLWTRFKLMEGYIQQKCFTVTALQDLFVIIKLFADDILLFPSENGTSQRAFTNAEKKTIKSEPEDST